MEKELFRLVVLPCFDLAETCFFLFLRFQGMVSTAVILMLTLGSSGALIHFLNRLQTHKYLSFASSGSASIHRSRYSGSKGKVLRTAIVTNI